jgi:DNA-directed RNA polymerase specialized sigma24 family protein
MIAKALSTNEKDSPLERTRLRLDWGSFARGLDHRRALLLQRLGEGYRKGEIADELGVSRCRVTQLLADLGERIEEHFSEKPAKSKRHEGDTER